MSKARLFLDGDKPNVTILVEQLLVNNDGDLSKCLYLTEYDVPNVIRAMMFVQRTALSSLSARIKSADTK